MDNFVTNLADIDYDSIVKTAETEQDDIEKLVVDNNKPSKLKDLVSKVDKMLQTVEETGADVGVEINVTNGKTDVVYIKASEAAAIIKCVNDMFDGLIDSDNESEDEENDPLYVSKEVIDQLKNDENNSEYFHAADKLKPLLVTASKYGYICGGYVRDVLAAEKSGPFNDVDLWFSDDAKFLAFYAEASKDGPLVCNNSEIVDYDVSLKVYRLAYYRDNNLVTWIDAAVNEHFHRSDFNIHKLAARIASSGLVWFVSLGPETPEYSVEVLLEAIRGRKAKVLPEFYTKWRKGSANVRAECFARVERLKKKGWDVDESEQDYMHIQQRMMALSADIKRVSLEGEAIVEEGNENVRRLRELLFKQTENAYEFVFIMNDSMTMITELDDARKRDSSSDDEY